jgi:hypothetical protein
MRISGSHYLPAAAVFHTARSRIPKIAFEPRHAQQDSNSCAVVNSGNVLIDGLQWYSVPLMQFHPLAVSLG